MHYVMLHLEYQLEIDREGWVEVDKLLDALHKREKWINITKSDLVSMIEQSEKKRHEIKDGRIRAFYGHSVSCKISKEEKMPPEVLYHGTARRFLKSIYKNGLQPQSRQYVHLSQDIKTAQDVAQRHDIKPCILIVHAKIAWDDGIKFCIGNENVWLADNIPSKYIAVMP